MNDERLRQIRLDVEIVLGCTSNNPIEYRKQRQMVSRLWREHHIWDDIPAGVNKIDLTNNIILRRDDPVESGAEWDLEDLDIYFRERFTNWVTIARKK